MRFLNDDVVIEAGTRTATKMSIEKLAEIMYDHAELTSDMPGLFTRFSERDLVENYEEAVYGVVESLLRLDETIDKDNKYNVCPYHCTTEIHDFGVDIGSPLGGFRTIGDLTFFGFFAGDAWEYATFMVIYHDGKSLRLYTPVRGNFVNTDYNTALGREFDKSDEDILASFGMFGNETQTLADIYVQKYGYEKMELEKVGFNFDAIKEDIATVIKVV